MGSFGQGCDMIWFTFVKDRSVFLMGNTLYESKNGNGGSVKEIIIEAYSPRSESGEKWPNLGCILKIDRLC